MSLQSSPTRLLLKQYRDHPRLLSFLVDTNAVAEDKPYVGAAARFTLTINSERVLNYSALLGKPVAFLFHGMPHEPAPHFAAEADHFYIVPPQTDNVDGRNNP